MKIARDRLLTELRTVEAGLSPKETIEQSTCFVFHNGQVLTYNDEVACRGPCSLPITGAVHARKLLDMLSRWPEDEIEFKRGRGRLSFKGESKRGYFITQDVITLPIKDIERPKKWNPIPTGLLEAISLVQECACRVGESPHLSCVHFSAQWVEACDGLQAGRVLLPTCFQQSVLLRAVTMKYLLHAEVSDCSETPNWVHFRNKGHLILSCRKLLEDYPSEKLTEIFSRKGSPAILPKGLKPLVDRLQVFLDDAVGSNWLEVEITSDHLQVTGRGEYGSQSERKQIKYRGKPLRFSISPKLLRDLTSKHDRCVISGNNLQIRKGKFQYVTSLMVADEKPKTKKKTK